MIISKVKVIILVSSVSFCSAGLAMTKSNTGGCNQAVEQQPTKVNSPSWWNWITGSNNGSQFHFFDLIELLHKNDKVAALSDEQKDGNKIQRDA